MLTELNALFTSRLATGSRFPMFSLDFLTLEAIVVVVIDLSVLRRLFNRVRVIRRYFCHFLILSLHLLAVFAEPMSTSRINTFTLWNVASRTAIRVVVINAIFRWLSVFIYRMVDSSRHLNKPLFSWLISLSPSETQ